MVRYGTEFHPQNSDMFWRRKNLHSNERSCLTSFISTACIRKKLRDVNLKRACLQLLDRQWNQKLQIKKGIMRLCREHPTKHVWFSESINPQIDNFYEAYKYQSTVFVKLCNVQSGRIFFASGSAWKWRDGRKNKTKIKTRINDGNSLAPSFVWSRSPLNAKKRVESIYKGGNGVFCF